MYEKTRHLAVLKQKELAVVTTASFALVWTMAKDGCRNQFHGCRILASAELYKARKAKAIIVSSDNYVKGYVAVARAVCEGRGIN